MKKITFDQEIHTFHIDFLGHVNNGVYIQLRVVRLQSFFLIEA